MSTNLTLTHPGKPPHRDLPTTSARPTRRQVLSAVGAGAAVALVASCTAESYARSGHLVASYDLGSSFPDLLVHGDESSHAVEVPGFRYRVERSGLLPTISRDTAAALGFLAADEADGKSAGDEEVRAPEGEVFLFAELRTAPPLLLSPYPQKQEMRSERILIGGEAHEAHGADGSGEAWPRPMDAGRVLQIALTVPADPAPDAAMFEVTCGDIVQRLSLVDGSRISSDMEPWYAQWYRATPEPIWWERDHGRVGSRPGLAGAVSGVLLRPALPDGTWPKRERMLLGVELAVLRVPEGITPRYDLSLVLPDGAELTPLGEGMADTVPSSDRPADVWFEVPYDIAAATVRIALGARLTDGEEIDLGTEEIPVTITAVER